MVTVLSTMHHDKNIMENHPKKLPEIIGFYNSTKSGVDTIDQLIETYTCKRQTNRWPVAVFSNIVDISALNAYVLWTEINPLWNATKTYKRRLFHQNLGLDLLNGEIERRKRLPRTQSSADIVRNVRAESEQPSTSAAATPKKRKASQRATCAVCPSSICRKTYEHCTICKKPVCPQHRTTVTVSTTFFLEHTN
ncbi:PREDICTED: uncharacterized protein LOC108368975 [Rhagoletis zephyria]|uniref:uncharacterized protein LOC108368975 n=1 Tax=Rhagoletis zephyria TaxID=28612 RepID=UPI0008115F2F|nr:PREDICTED: uncharacterized protein LOC108368975 [Rhagoletis zephyria]